GTDMIMVLILTEDVLNSITLTRVKKLSRGMNRIKGVDKVLSLFDLKQIRGENGALIVNPAVDHIPETEEKIKELRKKLKNNEMVYGNVVSKDFTVTAIIGLTETDVPDSQIAEQINNLLIKYPGPEETVIGGLPYIRKQIGDYISRDISILMPAGIIIMLVFLFLCFRQLRGLILPFSVVLMSILFGMGLIPLLGWKIHIITVLLPIFLIAVANDYGIHLVAKYQEDNIPSNNYSTVTLAKNMFRSLSKPVLLTGITTMAGMLCLLGHIIIPAQQMGILAAVSIMYALSVSLLFIPAVISLLPRAKPVFHTAEADNKKNPLMERILWFLGKQVSSNPKTILIATLIFTVFSAVGIFWVTVDMDLKNYFHDDHPVVYASNVIDTHLGGSQNISIVYQGDMKDPRLINKIDSVEHILNTLPEVGHTSSIARVIHQMSRALHKHGESGYNMIPSTRNGVAQYFELYSMSGDPEDFEKLVDFPYRHAVITARIKTSSSGQITRLAECIKKIVKEDKDVCMIGGYGLVLSDLSISVIRGQFISLFLAVFIVAILLMILFRSVTAGIISIIPIVLSITVLFGLMGLFGIELNIATALLSSIMIGVGIDYTIHFLWRYKKERKTISDPETAVLKSLTTTGRGIIFNAFSVIIGFAVLLFSSFVPVQFFGFLVVITIFACLTGALILVPSLCLIFRPNFLEPKQVSKTKK
ncbi:MAG: MMPL family transporter, partial [bacterium]